MPSSARPNKCIEGVPGFGFVIARKAMLEASNGNAQSLSLDLFDQWAAMKKTGQWRFTPPTHVVAAFMEALAQHRAEGGVAGRGVRYANNRDVMVAGMRDLGFETLLKDRWLSPIIVTFFCPTDPAFDFTRFYDAMKSRGFIIYPGKLTVVDSFRIGCIGPDGRSRNARCRRCRPRKPYRNGCGQCRTPRRCPWKNAPAWPPEHERPKDERHDPQLKL